MTRFGSAMRRVDERHPGINLPLLSVSQTRGILRQSELSDRPPRADSLDVYKVCRRGDIVFNKMSIRSGAMGVAPEDGLVTYHYEVMRPIGGTDPRYIVYLMKSSQFTAELIRRERGIGAGGNSGVRTTEVPYSALRTIDVFIPSPESQSAIADYLDTRTAKIDRLIGKQEQLIETLAERRQAVISHAATKGLDSNAPMKDSGVAWLGAVPSHWTVTAMKRILAIPITDGPHETPDFLDDGVPFVSAEAVSSGVIRFDKIRGHISPQEHGRFSRKYLPARNDIYVVKSGATTGVAAIVETDEVFNIWSPLAAIRVRSGVVPRFLLNFIRSREFQSAIELHWSYGTQQNIGMGTLGQLSVALPPGVEQLEIAKFLSFEMGQMDALAAKAREMIDVLKERRQALISAAVTGKIDVRGLS